MSKDNDLFAPPSESELLDVDMFSAPSEDELLDDDIFNLKETPVEGEPSQLEASGRGAIQGATLGFADELGAVALTPLEVLRKKISKLIPGSSENVDETLREQGFTGLEESGIADTYKELRDVARDRNKDAEEAHKATYIASDIAGGVLPGLLSGGGTAAAGVLKEGTKQAIKQAAKIGAGYGAASGLGYGEGDTIAEDIANTAIGAGIGGALGGAVPLALKGAKEGLKGLGKGSQNLLETIIPESDAIKAGYKYGKQGKKVIQEVIDEDLTVISKNILKNIQADKKANNLKSVKEKLDALGFKVNTKGAIDDAIDDLTKLTKNDVLGLQNKELLPKLRQLAGHDIQGEKLVASAQKQAIKKQIVNQGLIDEAIIKGEKNLAKKQIESGDVLETITDINRPMSGLDIPLQTSEGRIAGTRGKFKTPDGEEYVSTTVRDATPYQPEISKMIDNAGRPIVKTVDEGTGRVSAMVGNIEDKISLNLEKMSVTEVESLRKQLNLATKLAKAQGASDDPIMQRAQQLAKELKELADDVVLKSGDPSLVNRRDRFSDIYSAEELLGINKRLSVRSDINTELAANKLSGKLGFEQGFKNRKEGDLANKLLGEKIVTSEMKQQLDLIKKLNQISGRESQENISRAGLYKMAVGDVPNLVGRGVRGVENTIKPIASPVKNITDLINSMTGEQVKSLGTKFASSNKKGSQILGQRLLEAVSQEGPAKAQAVWALSQSPAFRELVKREVPNMESEMMETMNSISSGPEEEVTIGRMPASVDDRIDNIKEKEGFSNNGYLKKETELGSKLDKSKKNARVSGSSDYGLYYDSRGVLTAGYGHKIREDEDPKDFMNTTKTEATELLKVDIPIHDNDAYKVMDSFGIDSESLSEPQLDAIKDMVYQLGMTTSLDFKNTFKYIEEGKFEKAAENVTKSTWNKQTPLRVKDFQDRIVQEKSHSGINLNSIPQGYTETPLESEVPSEEEMKAIDLNIDRVNQQQSSGDDIPVDQIEGLMEKIDTLLISQEDKDKIENEAINMSGYSDGARLKELLAKIANLR